MKKRINHETPLVWATMVNEKEGKQSQRVVEEGFGNRFGCKAPPKAFNPKNRVLWNHSSRVDTVFIHIKPPPGSIDAHKRYGCGCK